MAFRTNTRLTSECTLAATNSSSHRSGSSSTIRAIDPRSEPGFCDIAKRCKSLCASGSRAAYEEGSAARTAANIPFDAREPSGPATISAKRLAKASSSFGVFTRRLFIT